MLDDSGKSAHKPRQRPGLRCVAQQQPSPVLQTLPELRPQFDPVESPRRVLASAGELLGHILTPALPGAKPLDGRDKSVSGRGS